LSCVREGIVPLAKLPGITSFSALWQVKDALKIKKTGHTGTLDTFADGLLVALTGRYTRLVPYITDCDKEYVAYVAFGNETDTLDPEGKSIYEAPLPLKETLLKAIERFTGEIDQIPPAYSAVHVDGKRASDRMRGGESIELQPRRISIYALEVLAMDTIAEDGLEHVTGITIRVECSKGTYIRSLARDIALASGSRAHLAALRRTRIGPFSLEQAAGHSLLKPFSRELSYKFGEGERPPRANPEDIVSSVIGFTPEMAMRIGLPTVTLSRERISDFTRGIHPQSEWFSGPIGERNAVFCDGEFMGTVTLSGSRIAYGFVFGGPS